MCACEGHAAESVSAKCAVLEAHDASSDDDTVSAAATGTHHVPVWLPSIAEYPGTLNPFLRAPLCLSAKTPELAASDERLNVQVRRPLFALPPTEVCARVFLFPTGSELRSFKKTKIEKKTIEKHCERLKFERRKIEN